MNFTEVCKRLNARCETSQDWWALVEDALDLQDERLINGVFRKLDSRCAGLTTAINKYNDILFGRIDPGRTTLGMCMLDGVDYYEMMRDRKASAESRMLETIELRDMLKAML